MKPHSTAKVAQAAAQEWEDRKLVVSLQPAVLAGELKGYNAVALGCAKCFRKKDDILSG